jgi:23S rRNA (uracil1939-C5)-methyltransferase
VTETLTIVGVGHSGDGIAETPTGRVFVPLTLPGEVAEVERDGNRTRLVRLVKTSSERIAPVCRHFGQCGTCALEHWDRAAYLAWKRDLVTTAFRQRGITAEIEPVVPIGLRSRRRAIFSVVKTARGMVLGFHRRGSNDIVRIEECPVLAPGIVEELEALRAIADVAMKPGRPGRLFAVLADNGLDVALQGAGRLDRPAIEKLGAFAGKPPLARLTVDGTAIFQSRRPEIAADGITLLPVSAGFLQAAAAAETALAEAVLAHVGMATPVADLFAGIGTFTLRLAKRAAVTAVDGETQLLQALDAAARRTSGLKPIVARKRDLYQNPLAPTELKPFGAVVFDPPATGAKAQAEALAASSVAKVAAVSCNPGTLARDARILIDGGYRLTGVLPVDQFLFSADVEAVATFEK